MALFRCAIHGVLPSGRVWSFRQYFTSGSSVATVQASWVAHFTTAWTQATTGIQSIYPVATSATSATSAEVTVVAFATGPKLREISVASTPLTLPGTASTPALPDNNAIVVTRRTATPGRGGRGRTRLPAPVEAIVTANEMDAVSAGHISSSMSALRSLMAADGHTAVLVVERPRKDLVPVGTTTAINLEETDRVIRSLRVRSKRQPAAFV